MIPTKTYLDDILKGVVKTYGEVDTDRLASLELRRYTTKDEESFYVFVTEGTKMNFLMFDNFVDGIISSVDIVNQSRRDKFSYVTTNLTGEVSSTLHQFGPITVASIIKEVKRVKTDSQLMSEYFTWLELNTTNYVPFKNN